MMLTRIVKVGGSLLGWPPLRDVLRTWLASEPAALNVLVCGGGSLVEVIRRADRDFSLGDETSHWRCIDLLSVTARVLAAVLRDVPLVETYEELLTQVAHRKSAMVVFDSRAFLREHEARLPGQPLPHGWEVTSDSIAGRLAEVIGADEIVLLKSSDPPSALLGELAAAGYVDRYFPLLTMGRADVRIINLRGAVDRVG
jgi:5-(aminomethyl)-3-furanmethanol phosphate kinase